MNETRFSFPYPPVQEASLAECILMSGIRKLITFETQEDASSTSYRIDCPSSQVGNSNQGKRESSRPTPVCLCHLTRAGAMNTISILRSDRNSIRLYLRHSDRLDFLKDERGIRCLGASVVLG